MGDKYCIDCVHLNKNMFCIKKCTTVFNSYFKIYANSCQFFERKLKKV